MTVRFHTTAVITTGMVTTPTGAVLQKSSNVRLSYEHCNFSRGCLPVKMASKTVIRCIEKGYQTEVFDRGFSSIHKPVNYLHCPACFLPVAQ